MEAEGAEQENITEQPQEVAAVSATVTDPLPSAEASSAFPIEVKEEVDYSDPTDTVTEVPTVDLSGFGESNQPEAVTPPPQSGDPSTGGAASSAPAEPQVSDVVTEGAGPSAPSRPPRTRGARGGKDTQFQKLRRAYFMGTTRRELGCLITRGHVTTGQVFIFPKLILKRPQHDAKNC